MSEIERDRVLASVEAKRGYLLPYHRMIAENSPELLAAYDAFYERLTLFPRTFSMSDREIVWAGLLAATREAVGTLHIHRAYAAGLGSREISDAFAVCAATEAWPALAFGGATWPAHVEESHTRAAYRAIFEAARGGLPREIAEVTALVCLASRRDAQGLQFHLVRAFEAGTTVARVAEALSYLLVHCGGPTTIAAVNAWTEMSGQGLVPPPYA